MNNQTQITNFLKYLTLHGVSPKSLKYYKSDLVNFLNWAEDRKITAELVTEYINSIRPITPTATLNRRLSTLRSYTNFMGFKKIAKSWQEKILSRFISKPKLQNLLHKVFFSRPNWYRTYHSFAVANYIHIAILVLFTSISGYAFYDQVFYSADRSLAFPASLTRPNRFLSFQGRLTDNLGNPKTVATDIVFKLYSVDTGGVALWDSGTCSITPDQDGIFSTLLGSSCGAEIDATIFSENAAIWLGATMGLDAEATPRIQIATVAYALNSETLQGFPAGTGVSTVPYINSAGTLVLANASPKLQSTSGTFAVEGVAMTLTTPTASDGIITINPDGVGTLDLIFEGAAAGASANGFVNATNANITSGALYGGTVASDATGYNFLDFQGGVSPTSKFSVSAIGDTTMAGDLTITGDDLFMATNTANYFLMADGTNYNPVSPATALAGLGLGAGGAGDIWVEKAGDTMTGALFIDGSADAVQLKVQGHSTQTANLQEWQNSGTGVLSSISGTGVANLAGLTVNSAYTFPTADGGASYVLSTDGSGAVTWASVGAASIGADVLDFTEFKDAMTLDASTNVAMAGFNYTFDGIGSVGIGTNAPDATALLDLTSTTQGFLAPRMTTIQRDAISTPATGLMVYNTDDNQYNVFDGSIWGAVGGGGGAWNDLTVPTGDLALAMDADTTTFDWTSAGALTAWTNNFINNSSSATTQNAFVINNALNDSASTDTTTENLLLLQQLDTTTGDAKLIANALKIDVAGNSGITNGLYITNSAGNLATGINIVDTAGGTLTTGIALSGTFGTAGIDAGNSLIINIGNAGTDFTSTGGLNLAGNLALTGGTISDGTDEVDIDDSLAVSAVLQVGGTSALTYSRFGTSTTDHGLSTANSVLVEGNVELDGTVFLDSGIIANLEGTSAIVLSSTPTTTANTLAASSWLIENGLTGNVGQAALMVNQKRDGDLFSASASGVPIFTIANTGAITSSIGSWTVGVTDSSTAVGIDLNVTDVLTTQGAKLLSLKNNSVEKFYIDKDGNLYTSGTILSGNGQGMLMTNKSGDTVTNRSLVVLDTTTNSSFTTTTTPYAKTSYGVVTGVGLGVANDADEDGNCDADDICMVAVGGEVEVKLTNATTASRGEYIFTGNTAGSGVSSAKQFDGLIGMVSNIAGAGSGYVKMIFKVQPQVAMGASVDKNSKHNEYWLYADQYTSVGAGSDTDTNLLNRGLTFDTFTDSTKTDSANTTLSGPAQMDSTTSRVGLMGGQTYNSATADNDGQNYVGADTTTDIYYYDRTKDSTPQVLTELGIDPNWYNGVTLSVATTSAQYSQNDTITQKNPNLSTSYNGSLIKVTGTDTEPRTIYITIKSPTTFDWTNYAGDAAAGVTITAGAAQVLGDTGVSVTFTATSYNVGDVFKIASWYIEAEGTNRGAKQQFPERSNIIATASSVDIIDADTQKLWMGFDQHADGYAIGVDTDNNPSAVQGLNGKVYVSENGASATGLYTLDFIHDASFNNDATDYSISNQPLSNRNTANTYNAISSSNTIVTVTANDVSAAVIPNQPTQEVTVSGWGYVYLSSAASASETVLLPYKFNNSPVVTVTPFGENTTTPTRLSDCNTVDSFLVSGHNSITTTSFIANLSNRSASAVTTNYCYTWSATGTVSPKQFVGTATDAGVSIINSTDGTAYSYSDATDDDYNAVSLTSAGRMYGLNETKAQLEKWRDIASNTASETNGTPDKVWDEASTPALTASAPTIQTTSSTLKVTEQTSTINPKNDTIYVGTSLGASVIQDNENWPTANDGAEETLGSVKYYTKDYISEEMVGNIQGMWGFNSALTDSSVKAATITAADATITYPSGVRGKGINITVQNGTATTTTIAANYSMGIWVKETAGWTYYVKTDAGTYINGVLSSTAFTNRMTWVTTTVTLVKGTQDVDEMFATNSTLTPSQIKHMYEVGYRSLQSHGTGLGGGAADANQQLGGTSLIVGAIQPDLNNQYMYVGTNEAAKGAVSKIQLNSDTNIKTYNVAANVPAGGTAILDEDINSLSVGYNLETVGSAASGVKSMGVDNYATATSGNYVSKTVTTAEAFSQAYIWSQYLLDASDTSNTVQAWASNDGGSNYYQCNLTNTDSSRTPTEYEYFCQFNTPGTSLKTKFVMARGSTKTNTYLTRWGLGWISGDVSAANGNGLYTNTSSSVADGSYLTVAHNQSTNDLLSSAWIYAQGIWKKLTDTYTPTIAWEGKDTQRGVYHNEVNLYQPSEETNIYTENLLQSGLFFDTFEDGTKIDSANTSTSLSTQKGDDGSANLMTLDQRQQAGRVGLLGGQTYNTATTDNDGQAYLGSDTVNDQYYYDRTKDSSPQVQVELGIDPNWYNGVTLSMATTSAEMSQAETITQPNPNLSTSYNGSLLKVTGTDSSPRSIYITIKSPTTFDWTNYTGDAATGVTITPGTAQALGTTGVSVMFTSTTYNVGDVFKIASWFIEAEGAARGAKQQFPERSNVIATAASVDIIDADTQKLWMRFSQGTDYALGPDANNNPAGIQGLNGKVYSSNNGSAGALYTLDFIHDTSFRNNATDYRVSNSPLSSRNAVNSYIVINTSQTIVSTVANDVSAAVIPDQPTQEVTVSGWGYVQGTSTWYASETVNFPYKFNSIPNVTTTGEGYKATAPTTLSDCTGFTYGTQIPITLTPDSITTTNFRNTALIASANMLTYYYCYTWTATGTVSPKQFVGTATDAGVSIINSTDGTAYSYSDATNDDYNAVSLTNTGRMYGLNETKAQLEKWRDIASNTASETNGTPDKVWDEASTPALTAATPTIQTTSSTLKVTEQTSTINPKNDTIYVGTSLGASVIQDNENWPTANDGAEETSGSVKYYTKDYISEEMVGNTTGMWPFYGTGAIPNTTAIDDISVKNYNGTASNANGTGMTYATGVRGSGITFDGTDDNIDLGATVGELISSVAGSMSVWIKPTGTPGSVANFYNGQGIIADVSGYMGLYRTNLDGVDKIYADNYDGTHDFIGTTYNNDEWTHIAWVHSNGMLYLYKNGQLVVSTASGTTSTTTGTIKIGVGYSVSPQYFAGSIDEPFVTATALTASQIKHMYEVGYRSLQSHGTGLGGGAADTNQQLGGTTNIVGGAIPDLNNQYMYVGTNEAAKGAVSKIQLNSDTNIKTYNVAANVPAGGTAILDEDINSLSVGYNLETVGSAASGVKSMGVDDASTSLSASYVSKTYALPKNIGSAVLWISPVLDASDASNTLVVKASNDAGSNYATCTLVNTNSNPAVPEKEYACTFAASDNDLKVKFEFARGSTKTNTYVNQFGITWLGQTGFRVEQTDANNVRLYNYSGEAQNLRLDVITGGLGQNSGTLSLAPSAADVDSNSNMNSLWINKTGAGGNLMKLQASGTDMLTLATDGTLYVAGNVGVGTAAPESKVQISGGGLCVGSDANCNSDNNTEGIIYSSSTAMTAYDLAENYPTKDTTLVPGNVVETDPTNPVFVQKSSSEKNSKLIGIVSTTPGVLLGGFNGSQFQDEYQVAITLSGRVPVKIAPDSEAIEIGDFLTSSETYPGMAQKATGTGYTVAKALESWTPGGASTIEAFVNLGYHDPDLALTDSGDILLASNSSNIYNVSTTNGITSKIGAFASATIAKLQAGIGNFRQVETSLISPIANTDLIIDLDPENATESSRLAIKGVNDEIVTSFDAYGNATISGTLYAEKIESSRLTEIEDLLAEVESNQNLLTESQNWNTNTATTSASFSELIADNIFITGNASVTSLFVSDNLTVKSIDSLDVPLSIQSLAAAPLEIMAGKIIIDTNGNAKFFGDVEIAGNLKLDGNIVIANSIDSVATESAEIIEGQINSNSTAGKAILPAGLTELRIKNEKLKINSLIYITPVSSTENKVLYVKSKDVGEFTIGFSGDGLDTDIEFNWWIIELSDQIVELQDNL